jgi:hypothetical protein
VEDRSAGHDLEALRDAVALAGLEVRGGVTSDAGADLVVVNPAGGSTEIRLKRMSLVTGDGLRRRVQEWDRQRRAGPAVGVLVADRITKDAREVLRGLGWGWLDLRGHLHLAAPGLFVDIDIPVSISQRRRPAALSGLAGLDVAAALLLDPDGPVTVRAMAGSLGRAPSTVSEILSRLREVGLIDGGNRPVTPELFWELADHWQPAEVDIRTEPDPRDQAIAVALQLGLDRVEHTTGWALTDTMAAVAYGAPVSARADHPPDFYVPSQTIQRRATQLLGTAHDHRERAATIRVAPVPAICSARTDPAGRVAEAWLLAHPLFVALDLAQDRGRGREILAQWTPPEPWQRVW